MEIFIGHLDVDYTALGVKFRTTGNQYPKSFCIDEHRDIRVISFQMGNLYTWASMNNYPPLFGGRICTKKYMSEKNGMVKWDPGFELRPKRISWLLKNKKYL